MKFLSEFWHSIVTIIIVIAVCLTILLIPKYYGHLHTSHQPYVTRTALAHNNIEAGHKNYDPNYVTNYIKTSIVHHQLCHYIYNVHYLKAPNTLVINMKKPDVINSHVLENYISSVKKHTGDHNLRLQINCFKVKNPVSTKYQSRKSYYKQEALLNR